MKPTKKCQYCGKHFTPTTTHRIYCSTTCRHYARLESKEKYQRTRRNLIRQKELLTQEEKALGTSNLKEHPKKDFLEEYHTIQKELQRLNLRRKPKQ